MTGRARRGKEALRRDKIVACESFQVGAHAAHVLACGQGYEGQMGGIPSRAVVS